jgi:hypothetical protein
MAALAIVATAVGPALYFAAWFFCRRPGVRLFAVTNIFRLDSQLSPLGVWLTAVGCVIAIFGTLIVGFKLLC